MKIGVGIVQVNIVYPNYESHCCADWCNKSLYVGGRFTLIHPIDVSFKRLLAPADCLESTLTEPSIGRIVVLVIYGSSTASVPNTPVEGPTLNGFGSAVN